MTKRIVDRYFVINWYVGKGGQQRATVTEHPTWEHSQQAALLAIWGLETDTGEVPEEFEVFVGSVSAMRRRLEERGARQAA